MRQEGFTLIELSIVLVIIGLIVGGVLVGRDLILAAEMRKTATMIEQVETAVNTFSGKYDCLPGDCAKATNFFPDKGGACGWDGSNEYPGYICNGNGDGDVYSLDVWNVPNGGVENSTFYHELILANLIKDTRYCTLNGITCVSFYTMNWGLTIPIPFSPQLFFDHPTIGVVSLRHATWRAGLTPVSANHAYYFGAHTGEAGGVMPPTVMASMDGKFDDGNALSGRIQALGFNSTGAIISNGNGSNSGIFSQASGTCNVGNVYSVSNEGQCAIMWMAGF